MLGVDCFSRAGWKEFWLYLWNLNSDVFPLNTNTYPLTKGIKVELAGVVILCIFGIISQLRLWKLIKERRDKKEEHRLQTAQNQQKEEEELGRKIEDTFHKERSQWEATYGNRSLHDSGHATPESPSLYEKEYLSTTLASTTQSTKPGSTNSSDKHANVTVVPVHEDEIQPIDARGAPLPILKDDVVNHSAIVSRTNSTRPSSEAVAASQISRSVSITSSLKPSAPPPPVIVPLPFRIPQEDDAKSQLSDNASVSALPDTQEDEPPSNQPLLSHRLSGKPAMKRLSTNRTSSDGFQAEDVVMISKLEDDRASSVAATLDEEDKISLREISPPHSPLNGGFDLNEPMIEDLENAVDNSNADLEAHKNGELRNNGTVIEAEGASTTASTPKIGVQTAGMLRSQPAGQMSPSSFGTSRQSLTISTDPKHEDSRPKHDLVQSPRLRHDTLVKGDSNKSQSSEAVNPNGSSSTSQDDKTGSIIGDLPNSLPARLSRVAQSYRTNEWAKHLETAEKPELDEIPEPESPGAQLDHERPAPVSEGIAQPFATSKRISKRVSSDSTVHRNNAFMQINSNSARQSHSELPSLSRQASQTLDRGVRVSGTQLPSVIDPVGRRVSSGPTQLPNQTLMGKRESLMRNRVSTQNFNQQTGSSNDLTAVNDEDMTLAQRRRALKYQKAPSASQKWQKNSWAAAPVEGFDSHQPKRTVGTGSDQKREVLLAGWRESIQQTGAPLQSPAAREEQQRAVMMNAKRQKEMEKQQQTLISQHRESMRHNMMRSNEMLDAHREAMRRMQAAANKNA
ncbi:hypothetical protein N0V90_001774 [Kalmusia sp. IMI 367209]|nr:hypothetical protein N0V90_001774 [Kalmusia sp. IMI 367209]